ncbi:hypothetical protein [Cutibacterium sp. V947]|uniref:hypothetical protein n=1 Tax=Cutibacterium sp. V947 TaxID=3446480 RepID=UPI003EDEA22A
MGHDSPRVGPTSSQDHVLNDEDHDRIARRYPTQRRAPWVILILVLAASGADHVRVGKMPVTFPADSSKDETIHTPITAFSPALTAELDKCGPIEVTHAVRCINA